MLQILKLTKIWIRKRKVKTLHSNKNRQSHRSLVKSCKYSRTYTAIHPSIQHVAKCFIFVVVASLHGLLCCDTETTLVKTSQHTLKYNVHVITFFHSSNALSDRFLTQRQ